MSAAARFTLCICLSIVAQLTLLNGQGLPSCEASSITLLSLQAGTEGLSATFALEEKPNVQSYTLKYEYLSMGTPMEDLLEVFPPTFDIALSADTGQHQFTILNNCLEGDTHLGSQLRVDLNDSDVSCPIPSNLNILDYNGTNISFQWAFNELALSWHVQYENAEGFVEEYDVVEPFVFQELSLSAFHIFTIYTQCEDQALLSNQLIRQSPAIQFMIITVDDIKALSIPCLDLCLIAESAYRLSCARHGKFEANKANFLSTHDCTCLSPVKTVSTITESLRCFPNPSTGTFELAFQLAQQQTLSIEVYDRLGKQIGQLISPTTFSAGSHRLEYRLSDLAKGLYWLQISNESHLQYLKIMVF